MVEDRLTEEQIGQILRLFVDAGLPAAFDDEGEDEGEDEAVAMEGGDGDGEEDGQEDR